MAIDRGSTVFFEDIQFTDENGDAVEVDTAELTLEFTDLSGTVTTEAITLTYDEDEDIWSGSWDSSVAQPGTITGHLMGEADDIKVAKDFKFKLTANKANELVHSG